MLKNLSKLVLAICVLSAGGIVANAQIDSGVTVEGNIPFSFVVGKTTLPAGRYELRALEQMQGSVILQNVNGKNSVTVETEAVQANVNRDVNKSEFIFDKMGDTYFLSQVWLAGTDNGSQFDVSEAEKDLADKGTRKERHSIAATMKRLKP
jgi:hypothetical protein